MIWDMLINALKMTKNAERFNVDLEFSRCFFNMLPSIRSPKETPAKAPLTNVELNP